MPLFGSRMVCETANYKHIQKRKQEMAERESKLAQWYKEKAERKEKLRLARERLRQGSVCSTASTVSSVASVRDEAVVGSDQGSFHFPPLEEQGSTKGPDSPAKTTMEMESKDTTHIVGDGHKGHGLCGDCVIQ